MYICIYIYISIYIYVYYITISLAIYIPISLYIYIHTHLPRHELLPRQHLHSLPLQSPLLARPLPPPASPPPPRLLRRHALPRAAPYVCAYVYVRVYVRATPARLSRSRGCENWRVRRHVLPKGRRRLVGCGARGAKDAPADAPLWIRGMWFS